MAVLVAVRDALLALALGWVGISIDQSVRDHEPNGRSAPEASSSSVTLNCSVDASAGRAALDCREG